MSGESAAHARLVKALVHFVRERHQPPRGLVVFADHHDFGSDRPPRIGRHMPDVFASDLPVSFRLIGEAKTGADLETDRTRRQIRAFLDHLSLYPGSSFYLAVPPLALARARFVLRSVTVEGNHGEVSMTVTSCDPC